MKHPTKHVKMQKIESSQNNKHCILGCFIFSPFLKLKMLGVVSNGVFDADFEYVICISLWRHFDVAARVRNSGRARFREFSVSRQR